MLHIFDRGFATEPWLHLCVIRHRNARVVRWPHGQYLIDEQGRARKAWEIARGKRAWGKRRIWNAHLHRHLETSVLAFPARHPDFAGPDVLGSLSTGQRTPSLVSGFPGVEVRTEQQAWKIVFAYARSFDIEGTWRFSKSELGFECPRVRSEEGCRKLLMMATLAYAFLLTLMSEDQRQLRTWLLDHYCHRRGNKARLAHLPLYRLRLALSRLWQRSPPHFELLGMRRLA